MSNALKTKIDGETAAVVRAKKVLLLNHEDVSPKCCPTSKTSHQSRKFRFSSLVFMGQRAMNHHQCLHAEVPWARLISKPVAHWISLIVQPYLRLR